MSRHLEPYQENPFIEIGRLISEESYKREKKEVTIQTPEGSGGMIIDILKRDDEEVIVAEIKKSSSFEKSAKMQLAYYLLRLKRLGVEAKGELLFPKEKKKISVTLTEEIEKELIEAEKQIRNIISLEKPPKARSIKYCKKCGYQELCWS